MAESVSLFPPANVYHKTGAHHPVSSGVTAGKLDVALLISRQPAPNCPAKPAARDRVAHLSCNQS
jgi:hypothetical protein